MNQEMKKMRRLFAVLLAAAMMAALAVTANAASITITRDNSYNDGSGAGRVYNYYKVFSASYSENSSAGGGSTNGVPGDVSTSAANASYTATSAVAEKLGTWNPATMTWTRAEGNEWFDLTPNAGTDPQTYSVKWIAVQTDDNGNPVQDTDGKPKVDDSAATVQAAAAWLIENAAYESGPKALTFANGKWSSGEIDPGYYLIAGDTGKNLVAATSDITITEKNTYPPLDKTQADEDNNNTQSNDPLSVAVGDVLTYHVKVTIPATAKEGDKILVWDKASSGLKLVGSLSVEQKTSTGDTPGTSATVGSEDYTGLGALAENEVTWQRLITVVDGSQGNVITFTFQMEVKSDALTDTDKQNESGLKYGNGSGDTPFLYESKPDSVEFKTYFAGIYKFDADTKVALTGVKFTLKENGSEFKVSKVGDYYVYDMDGDTTVTTDDNGLIKIRGLDKDKTYTLTETNNPIPGYNMLAAPVTLTLYEDTVTTATYKQVASDAAFDSEETYFTKVGDNYSEEIGLNGFASGVTYYTVETASTVAFNNAGYQTFDQVENKKGAVLPGTGGVGTKIFYALGAVLVVGAGVVLVSRKRADS